jgi:hypothetical protein
LQGRCNDARTALKSLGVSQTFVISSETAAIFIKPQMSAETVCKPLIFPMFPAIPA